MSLLVRRFFERASDPKVAILDADGEHAYDRVVRRACAIAETLPRDERIAILAPPGADFVAAFYGVLIAGSAVVVLSPLHPLAEKRYFCNDAGVARVLAARSLHAEAPEGAILIDDLPRRADHRPRPIDPSSPALQLYTSGTTGRPKGAVLTHANLAIQQELVGSAWGFSDRDVLLHSLPLHHMHGLAIALLTALGAGATIRLRPFDARSLWDEMHEASVFMGVPAMYHRLFVAFDAATDEERARWSRHAHALRLATSGSAALPVTLAERWKALTGKIPLERFGMTEIGVGISNVLDGERFPGAVGFPLPTVETRIVDDEGRDADVGELWIRGPSVFAGYHERPDETARAFAEDGWFRTGDTVTREASLPGRPFKILGRTSVDILKSGGYKLSALEIEEVIREHAAIAEVAVVGVPDDAWGERVVACAILRDGHAVTAEALRAFVRDRLAPYKVPKDVLFVRDLPKNMLGKVVKPTLVAELTSRAAERSSSPAE
jgi:malonyl-CoA/methylmalonyl-CoA synthetase